MKICYTYMLLLSVVLCNKVETNSSVATEFTRASIKAEKTNRNTLIIFKADWCPDCHALDKMMQQEPLYSFLSKNFVTMKVDVCRYDCNMDFAARFGNPVARGIPALVITNAQGQVLASTNNGEFSSARKMRAKAVEDYLAKFVN